MAENEFIDHRDKFGFVNQEPEPYKFLSLDYFEKIDHNENTGFVVRFFLSSRKNYIERQVYTFFTLLGDFGGFNGAIVMFPSYLMSLYSSKMFNNQILQELPIKKKRKKSQHDMSRLKSKLADNSYPS